jgi:transposase
MSAPKERIEVITRGERRRHWTADQKRDIAIESLTPGAIVAAIARRHEIGTGLLYTWRKQLLSGELGRVPEALPRFLQVDVTPPATSHAGSAEPPSSPVRTEAVLAAVPRRSQDASCSEGMIEIILTNGVRVRVGAGPDEAALRRVLALLAGR